MLAEELEVSVRTIYRDIGELQAAGAPLWTRSGPQGGIHLLEGWRTDLDGLTDAEAAALFVGGPPSVVGQLGLGAGLAAAQVKMLATLSPAAARRAEEARARFLLDAPGWFDRQERVDALPTLAEALWTNRRVRLHYQRGSDPVDPTRPLAVDRVVDPLGLVVKAGRWYLVARSEEALRTYRVSRVQRADLLGDTFDRPPAFDLAAAWSELSVGFDRSILRLAISVRVSPGALRHLPSVVPSGATVEAVATAGLPDAEGWRQVDLRVESERVAVSQLLSLGAGVEVLQPESLRRALADAARQVADRNG